VSDETQFDVQEPIPSENPQIWLYGHITGAAGIVLAADKSPTKHIAFNLFERVPVEQVFHNSPPSPKNPANGTHIGTHDPNAWFVLAPEGLHPE